LKPFIVVLLALFTLTLCPARARAEGGLTGQMSEFLTDKGKDWLKGQAEDWVFDSGYSETMHQIFDAAAERADGDGNDKASRCQGAVMGLASTVLHNKSYGYNAKAGAKLAFDTLTKTASLAAGGLGAAAEGGTLSWLAGEYTGAAKDQAADSALEAIKKAFIEEKEPEFEIFEETGATGVGGQCDYTLRAVWDIVNGTYTVYMSGDCHCKMAGNVGVAPTPLGAWWKSFQGNLKLVVDKAAKTATWVPLPPKLDFDAQCACGKRPLRRPFPPPPSTVAPVPTPRTSIVPPTTTTTPPPVTTGPSVTPPPYTPPPGPSPVLPKTGLIVCVECQRIQDRIDSETRDLSGVESRIAVLRGLIDGDNVRIARWEKALAAEATKPGSSGAILRPDQMRQEIADDKANLAKDTAELQAKLAEKAADEQALVALGKDLADCLARHCPHESVAAPSANTGVTYDTLPIGLNLGLFNELNHARGMPSDYTGGACRGAVSGRALETLRMQMPMSPFVWSPQLAAAALRHANDQGPVGGFGHIGTDGSLPRDRMWGAGVKSSFFGEIISYGQKGSSGAVCQLLGEPQHEDDIYDTNFYYVGISCGPNAKYSTMCVVDLAGKPPTDYAPLPFRAPPIPPPPPPPPPP